MITISDDYTGALTTHEVQRLSLPGASILKTSVGPMDNNVYAVTCAATGESLLIDAANDAEHILALVREHAPGTVLLVTTHHHGDHWQALAEVTEALGVPTAASAADAGELPVEPDRILAHGDRLRIGQLDIEVIELRGHTPGGLALALTAGARTHVIAGDSLFPGGVGKTPGPEEFGRLLGDVTSRLFDRFDDATVIHPGHGKDTTLGAERPHLGEWRERGW